MAWNRVLLIAVLVLCTVQVRGRSGPPATNHVGTARDVALHMHHHILHFQPNHVSVLQRTSEHLEGFHSAVHRDTISKKESMLGFSVMAKHRGDDVPFAQSDHSSGFEFFDAHAAQGTGAHHGPTHHWLLHVKTPLHARRLESLRACLGQEATVGRRMPFSGLVVHRAEGCTLSQSQYHQMVTGCPAVRSAVPMRAEWKMNAAVVEDASAVHWHGLQAGRVDVHPHHTQPQVHSADGHFVSDHRPYCLHLDVSSDAVLPSVRQHVRSALAQAGHDPSSVQVSRVSPRHLALCFASQARAVQLMHPTRRHSAVEALGAFTPEGHRTDLDQAVDEEHGLYAVRLPASLPAALVAASRHPHVSHVSRDKVMQVSNRYASHVLQGGGSSLNQTYMWSHSLLGTGEKIQVGDTGADPDHCFFDDEAASVPVNSISATHRKFLRYKVQGGDTKDLAGGHGTHVTGSVAGFPISSTASASVVDALKEYQGAAPDAKVDFWDFDPSSGALNVPSDLYDDYFTSSHDSAGTRISSNSWGSSDNSYGSFTSRTDEFAVDHPDFLIMFAAGNYGDSGSWTSLTSPSIAKNALAVGATMTTARGFNLEGSVRGFRIGSNDYTMIPAAFGGSFNNTVMWTDRPLQVVSPTNGCSAHADMTGKICVVKRGTCSFHDKAKHCQNAGAVMMLVYNNLNSAPFVMGTQQSNPVITIPLAMCSKAVGETLTNSMNATAPVFREDPDFNENRMASFSSRGPTQDQRIKPDVCSPGDLVWSSRSDGSTSGQNCLAPDLGGIVAMQGTSMATPLLAGTMALVRQYFRTGQGVWRTVANSNAHSMTPTAALLRAVAMTATADTAGEVNTGSNIFAVQPSPSFFQGFGRVHLSNALRFSDEDNNVHAAYQLLVEDGASVATGDLDHYCFFVYNRTYATDLGVQPMERGNISLRASLTWNDPVAAASAYYQLVNDLDLSVTRVVASEVLVGNGAAATPSGATNDEASSTEAGAHWDYLNNAERVTLRNDPAGLGEYVVVTVRGTDVSHSSPQTYGLAVSVRGEYRPLSECTTEGGGSVVFCPDDCNSGTSQGTCGSSTGVCSCNAGWTGTSCNVSTVLVDPIDDNGVYGRALSQTLESADTRVYSYTLNAGNVSSFSKGFSFRVVSSSGDPDLYLSHGSVPTQTDYEYADESPAGVLTQRVYLPAEAGTYYMTVYSFCCSSSSYSVYVENYSGSSSSNDDDDDSVSTVYIVGFILAICIGAAIFAYYYCVMRPRRLRRMNTLAAAQAGLGPGVQMMSVNAGAQQPGGAQFANQPPPVMNQPPPAYHPSFANDFQGTPHNIPDHETGTMVEQEPSVTAEPERSIVTESVISDLDYVDA